MSTQTLTQRPQAQPPRQQTLPLHWRTEVALPVRPAHQRRSSRPANSQTELERLAGRLAGAIAEVYCGTRPISQLRPYLAPREYKRLAARVKLQGRPEGPVRSVLSVHVAPAAGPGAEVCAVIQGHRKSLAVAMRLRQHRDRWLATAVEIR